jgi:hypothetical protein
MNRFEEMDKDLPGAGEHEKQRAIETSQRNMEGFIGELEDSSKFERTATEKEGVEALKSREGEDFVTRRIESPNDPLVREIWQMMKEEFGDEADPLYWVKESIKEGISQYDVVTTPDGKIISFSSSQYLEMDPKEGNPSESMVYTAFILTKEEYRRKGLATELEIKLSTGALKKAKEESHMVRGTIGECTETSEEFWNKMGERRIYFEDSEGNMVEVPYKAPPVDFDSKTGDPTVDGAYEHLMINLFDGKKEISTEGLLRMVKTIFKEYVADSDDYDSKVAWKKAQDVIDGYLRDLESILAGAKDGKIYLMNKDERGEIAKKGKKIEELKTGEE